MSFTNKIINGSDILLRVDGMLVAGASSHTIEVTNSVVETNYKEEDDGTGNRDYTKAVPGKFSYTVSVDALVNLGYDSETGTKYKYIDYIYLLNLMKNKQKVEIIASYDDSTDTMLLYGEGILTSVNQTSPDGDNATYSVSIQGNGALEVQAGLRYPTPTNFQAENSGVGMIQVGWDTVAGNGDYEISYKPIDEAVEWTEIVVDSSSTFYNITGLAAGIYLVRLRKLGVEADGFVDSKYTPTLEANA